MRLFDARLLADYSNRIDSSDWSEPTQITNKYIYDIRYYANQNLYCGLIGGGFYTTDDLENDFSEWTLVHERIGGGGAIFSFNVFAFPLSFSVIDAIGLWGANSDDGGRYAVQYVTHTGGLYGGFSDVTSFPTNTSWTNCKWRNAVTINNGVVIVGDKTLSKGAFTIYLNYSGSYRFTTPKVISTNYLTNIIKVGKTTQNGTDNYYIAIGGGGYVATTKWNTYDIYSLTEATWDTQQLGSGTIVWKYIASGNGIVAICSNDGWVSYSKDYGTTWSEPTQISMNDIFGVVFAYNKFFIIGRNSTSTDVCSISTGDFKKFSQVKKIYTSTEYNGNAYPKYIFYDDNKIFLITSESYLIDRTWKQAE